jgi:DNA-binding MarR family transcriptional regulator
MTNNEAKKLEAALARLQTEINRLDRLTAATYQVGTAEDLQVLRLLRSDGPLRVGEIASQRASSVANISARLDRLEKRGLLTRERPPGDRRAVVAVLSDTGKELADRSRRDRVRALRPLSDDTSIATVQQVTEALVEHAAGLA